MRLCCLTTIFDPTGYIPVAYDGCKYALAPAIEVTAGYKSGEPVFMKIPKGYAKDDKKVCCQGQGTEYGSQSNCLLCLCDVV